MTIERTAERLPLDEALARVALATTDAARNVHACSHAAPEAGPELRRASAALVAAARAIIAAREVLTGDRTISTTEVH